MSATPVRRLQNNRKLINTIETDLEDPELTVADIYNVVREAIREEHHQFRSESPVLFQKSMFAANEAATYYREDPAAKLIYRYFNSPAKEVVRSEPVKMLVAGDGPDFGLVPQYYGPCKRWPFVHVVIDVSEREHTQILAGNLRLPKGWYNPQELSREGYQDG